MSSQPGTKSTGLITRTSILILAAALLGMACFGLGPAGMRVYLLLAGVAGLIGFFGLDYISRKAPADASSGKSIDSRMQQHAGRVVPRSEEKTKAGK